MGKKNSRRDMFEFRSSRLDHDTSDKLLSIPWLHGATMITGRGATRGSEKIV